MKVLTSLIPTLASLVVAFATNGKRKSIDKQILDAAPSASMFDVFHVMPEGDVKVMTELDLLLTMDQYKRLHGTPRRGALSFDDGGDEQGSTRTRWNKKSKKARRRRFKRKADQDEDLRWPNCKVYYEVDNSFSAEDKQELNDALKEWRTYTCLDFIESASAQSRIQFRNGGGCYSQLGRQKTPQILALAPTCRTKGIIAHEIGHAIGWYHEHMRPDRDDYISINFDAIPMRYRINFDKYTSDVINTHDVEYDYTSLMHYGNNALPGSITALDPDYQDQMGQREGLTFKDIKLANVMYECAKVMNCKIKTCPYGGFQLYKPYKNSPRCECWCDSGDLSDPLALCSDIGREPPKPVPRPTETPVIDLCYDVREDCVPMKEKGHCMSKMDLMMDACRETCGFCGSEGGGDSGIKGPEPCMDHDKGCAMMAATGLCTTLEPVMIKQCPASCDFCPAPPDPCKIQQDIMGLQYDAPRGGVSKGAPSNLITVLTGAMVAFVVVIRRA